MVEAKKLCPQLVTQHVATWREGDTKWAYRPDAAANIATDKVSLDPYRLESRRILAVIKEHLPSDLQRVEKASIDEVFLDLSAQVYSILLERYPELASPPPYDDASEKLPMPPVTFLDWQADALVDLEDEDAEFSGPDWDDVAMLVGSEIVRRIRTAIREKLGYTCSAGIATNKMLSKLGSGHKKPNQQTVIRSRAVKQFLSGIKFTKIRYLGGKLGDQIAESFKTEAVKDLFDVPVEQLKSKLGDETGVWVYNTIRGVDTSEVNSRTEIKSMLSAKSFRPGINTFDQGIKWLRIFAADIFSRLVEDGVLENKRRPKTINLHHRHGGQTRSRQSPIPQGKILDEETLFDLAQNLLHQITLEGRVWPCANLSLSVGGFQDGITDNMGIGAFLLKGEEAQALKSEPRPSTPGSGSDQQHQPAEKRRKLENPGIERFFTKEQAVQGIQGIDHSLGSDVATMASHNNTHNAEMSDGLGRGLMSAESDLSETLVTSAVTSQGQANRGQDLATDLKCSRCNAVLEHSEAFQNHQDWHLAKDLQDEERVKPAFANSRSAPASASQNHSRKNAATTPSRRSGSSKKPEAGQSRLKFG